MGQTNIGNVLYEHIMACGLYHSYYGCVGQLKAKGVLVPTIKDIYEPILDSLKEEGIEAEIKTISV